MNRKIMTDRAKGESISVGGVALEPAYAGFMCRKVTENEKTNPGLGYTVAYERDLGGATICIYSKNHREIPDGPSSQVAMEEFEQATQEILLVGRLPGKKVELVDRYGTGSPEWGREFLCAEFVLSDEVGSRRTFLYLTGAANQFVKITATLRTDEASNPAAREFADAVASGLWRKNTGRHEVLGLVSITTFGPWSWHIEDLNEPTVRGKIFRCYEEGNYQELSYLLVGDVSNDPDEPDITRLTHERVAEVDALLETEIRKLMSSDGRRMVRWMSSQLNETANLKGLVTAYIAEDHGRDRQYIDLRIPVGDRKIVVAGCFDVDRADEFVAPIVGAIQNATILNHPENRVPDCGVSDCHDHLEKNIMRRLISFVFAAALAISGAAAFVWLLLYTERVRGLFLIGAAMAAVVGIYWLWEDFRPTKRKLGQ
jgi:hypothetical protein